jgi:hypothetical protein
MGSGCICSRKSPPRAAPIDRRVRCYTKKELSPASLHLYVTFKPSKNFVQLGFPFNRLSKKHPGTKTYAARMFF